MIDLRRVTYTYPGQDKAVLADLDLTLDAGRTLLVAGTSGAGKSTLLRIFNGLVPHFHGGTLRGRVRVAGWNPVELGPRGMSRHVGCVVQDPETHFVTRRVEDELAFVLENHAVAPEAMEQRIDEVLRRLSIESLRHRLVETLSGGEQQRVAIASVLALGPELLVLDEPTSQLDPIAAAEVVERLTALRDQGTTLVLSEHRLQRVLPLADRIMLLSGVGDVRLGSSPAILDESPLAPPGQRLQRHLERHFGPGDEVGIARRLDELCGPSSGSTTDAPADEDTLRPSVLQVDDLHVTLGRHPALDGIDLTFRRGVPVAILGRNGAGKSTLLESLLGLMQPTSGDVRWNIDGRSLNPRSHSLRRLTRHIAFVPQNPARLMFHETVGAEMAFSLRGRDLPPHTGADLLERYGLEKLHDAYPRDLSSGERLRLGLALMTACEPAVLLLDEPTRGLDEVSKSRFTAHLRELQERGVTIIMATHDVELVATVARRVVMLDGGRVVDDGPTGQVLARWPPWQPDVLRRFGHRQCLTVPAVLQRLGISP